jgi:NADPH:quinone reductase-like Zn-dependent oxidoreductase
MALGTTNSASSDCGPGQRIPEKLAVAKKYVYDRLADGSFYPKIAKTFSFAQTVDAYRYLESNAQIGKIVITVP